MAARSVRRRKHKQLRRVLTLQERQRLARAIELLSGWQREARRRANSFRFPAVWQLTTDPQIRAIMRELDPTGQLFSDLSRVCAEAVAAVVDRRMVRSGLPLAERTRRTGSR